MRLATIPVLLTALVAPAAAQTPSVDELIAKNIAARGGEQKLKAINTRKIAGTVSAQGMEIPMTVLAKRPDKMFQEMSVQGQRIVTAYDGQQAWTINPMMGGKPAPLTGPQADMLEDQAWFDGPLAGARQRGDKMEIVGREDLDGKPAWKLAITRPGGQTTHIHLDAESFLERQVSARIGEGGTAMDVKSVISDYQPVDGVLVPRKVETTVGGQPQASVTITAVEFNVPIDDTQFAMPQG